MVLRMRPYKDITRMRITMHETSNKNLIRKCTDKFIHDVLFTVSETFQFLIIGYFYPIDPL